MTRKNKARLEQDSKIFLPNLYYHATYSIYFLPLFKLLFLPLISYNNSLVNSSKIFLYFLFLFIHLLKKPAQLKDTKTTTAVTN
ncbi:unnamed protein product [Meloidogyne enterolobii]|uniref:Uncharacterized protein n=1 Tax=Meloidogyne enterolobii TaxID=390850 RepID=A0ACB0XR24_MELEN